MKKTLFCIALAALPMTAFSAPQVSVQDASDAEIETILKDAVVVGQNTKETAYISKVETVVHTDVAVEGHIIYQLPSGACVAKIMELESLVDHPEFGIKTANTITRITSEHCPKGFRQSSDDNAAGDAG